MSRAEKRRDNVTGRRHPYQRENANERLSLLTESLPEDLLLQGDM